MDAKNRLMNANAMYNYKDLKMILQKLLYDQYFVFVTI